MDHLRREPDVPTRLEEEDEVRVELVEYVLEEKPKEPQVRREVTDGVHEVEAEVG